MFGKVVRLIGLSLAIVGMAYAGAFFLPAQRGTVDDDYVPPSVLTLTPEPTHEPLHQRRLPAKIDTEVA